MFVNLVSFQDSIKEEQIMFKLLIFSALIVIALCHPALRITRDTDGEANQNALANPTEVKEDGTSVDERFGGHGHRPYGNQYGYGQQGYGAYGQRGYGQGLHHGGMVKLNKSLKVINEKLN